MSEDDGKEELRQQVKDMLSFIYPSDKGYEPIVVWYQNQVIFVGDIAGFHQYIQNTIMAHGL